MNENRTRETKRWNPKGEHDCFFVIISNLSLNLKLNSPNASVLFSASLLVGCIYRCDLERVANHRRILPVKNNNDNNKKTTSIIIDCMDKER